MSKLSKLSKEALQRLSLESIRIFVFFTVLFISPAPIVAISLSLSESWKSLIFINTVILFCFWRLNEGTQGKNKKELFSILTLLYGIGTFHHFTGDHKFTAQVLASMSLTSALCLDKFTPKEYRGKCQIVIFPNSEMAYELTFGRIGKKAYFFLWILAFLLVFNPSDHSAWVGERLW